MNAAQIRVEAILMAAGIELLFVFFSVLTVDNFRLAAHGKLDRNAYVGIRIPRPERSRAAWAAANRIAYRWSPLYVLFNLDSLVRRSRIFESSLWCMSRVWMRGLLLWRLVFRCVNHAAWVRFSTAVRYAVAADRSGLGVVVGVASSASPQCRTRSWTQVRNFAVSRP